MSGAAVSSTTFDDGGRWGMMNTDGTWPTQPPASPPVEVDAPTYLETDTETMRSGFPVGQIVALLIGLMFLVGVGALAIGGFSGEREGAESPEAAVVGLADALSAEDVVAALEVMAPSEVGTASQLYPKIVDLAVKEGALDTTDWLAGVDFTVTGLETRTTQLHSGVALVELVDGTISVSIDPDVASPMFTEGELDMSVSIAEMKGRISEAVGEAETLSDDLLLPFPFAVTEPQGIFIMTVKRNGGWFVSPLYTAAEYSRQVLDLPPADFSASRENAGAGADSARAVIDDIVAMVNERPLEDHLSAALNGDPDGLFAPLSALVPPDEAGVFLDYAASYTTMVEDLMGGGDLSMDELTEEFNAMIAELDLEGQVSLKVDIREQARDDGTVVLRFGSGEVSLQASVVDPDSREVTTVDAAASWDGLCGRAEARVNGVAESDERECVPDDLLPQGFDEVFVVVGQVDGDWYISYVETALAYAEIFLEGQLEG